MLRLGRIAKSLHVVIAAEGSFAVLCGHEKERMAGYASHAVLTLHLLMTKKIHRLALMLCALCLTEMGWASDGRPQTDGDTIKTYDIDEIVITSSRKETNRTEQLPGALTVLSPRQADLRQIGSVKRLSAFIPNLYIPDYGSRGTSAIYIRGVGARSSGQTVGLYVDDVPYPDKGSFDFELPDIRRIEVLRGPQGTLYGRNAMGGIIHVHTFSPLEHQGTRVGVTYGNYGNLGLRASHAMRLGDRTGLQVGGYYRRHTGFFENVFDGTRADGEQTIGGNVKVVRRFSNAFTATLAIVGSYTNQGAFPYGLRNDSTGRIEPVNLNDPSSYRRTTTNSSLTLKYVTPQFVATYTTGWQFLHDRMEMDQDFMPLSLFTLDQRRRHHAFNQELSVTGTVGRYRWTVGACGFYDHLRTNADVTFKEEGIRAAMQKAFDGMRAKNPRMPRLRVTDNRLELPSAFDESSLGMAIYHQSTLDNFLLPGLSLTAGLRMDIERRRLHYEASGKMNLAILMPPVYPKETDISALYPASSFDEHLSSDEWQVLPRLALRYAWTPRTSLYAAVAKGYKTGGYNVQMSADLMQSRMQNDIMDAFRHIVPTLPHFDKIQPKEALAYRPENAWCYEAGIKSEPIKNRLHTELTVFYMDIRDLQLTHFTASGTGRMLSNAGRAVSCGIEASLSARIASGLTADVNWGYTHATFRNYNDGRTDYRGKFIPYAPRHTVSLGIHYERRLHSRLIDRIFAAAQYNGVGPIHWTEANDIRQPFYHTLDARAGIGRGALTCSLGGQNLTGTDYAAFYFRSFGRSFIQKGRPAQVAIRLEYAF